MSERPNYETMYILRPDIAEDEVETHTNKYRDLVIETSSAASVAWLTTSVKTARAFTFN